MNQTNANVELLSNVVITNKFIERIKTNSIIDLIFGGQENPGIVEGSTILLTGSPGAGKSTFSLQLADLLSTSSKRKVLYNICEESIEFLKIKTLRIGTKGDFLVSQIKDIDFLVDYCITNNIRVLIQDSMQSLCMPGESRFTALRSIVRKLNDVSKKNDIISIIVGHVTKGNTFAGPQEVKHEVDCHMHMSINDDGSRVLELQKNRIGPSFIPYEFLMLSSGLIFKARSDDETQNIASAEVEDKIDEDEVKASIRKMLLDGSMLSLSKNECKNICSDGVWRGLLELVSKKLYEEGWNVVESKQNGEVCKYIDV